MTKVSPWDSLQFDRSPSPLLIVLSGPSGAGKDALLVRLRETDCPLEYITTLTTRARRAKERDNLDYHFVSSDKFQEMIKNNELLEWANVYGNWYGVPGQPVKTALEMGRDTIVKVDTQGAATIKRLLPQAVFVFLMPPSVVELSERLTQRRTESPFDLALRIKTAREEIEQLSLFDYVIVNRRGEIDRAVAQIEAIITAEKCRAKPRGLVL
ncbi:MAG TPA: guanylate kinase [Dehalococcoidales bacterium]|nr:guanylate kinase [Dehalococcoidia bacterium]HUU08448.1 guanylate kinase [Dehalococcoidales bacterium]